jgi:ankyrin repeat protein
MTKETENDGTWYEELRGNQHWALLLKLQHSILNGDLKKTERHIEELKTLGIPPKKIYFDGGGGDSTPLHYAAQGDSRSITKYLLAEGLHPNQTDKGGQTPLHTAASRHPSLRSEEPHLSPVITQLLANGADPNVIDNDGRTPLHLAAFVDNIETAELLISANGEPSIHIQDKDNLWTPLHFATLEGSAKFVEYLLQKGAAVESQDYLGDTPLSCAAGVDDLDSHGIETHTRVMEILLKAGANIHHKNYNGDTPLHLACKYGHPTLITLLLDHKANVLAKNHDNITPLQIYKTKTVVGPTERKVLSILEAALRKKVRKALKKKNPPLNCLLNSSLEL